MSQENINLTVLGLEVAFRSGADMDRVRDAVSLVEERYSGLRTNSGQSKDILLTFLALGLADDVLQSQKKLDDVQKRIMSMLSLIEKSDKPF
ncbi:MAG: cell division protein ZapA [Desulfovibrio sp.]|nr:cell division protein ZapA [Desulfovibrio sp.]MDR3362981.1 cell division protein ZapA [Desulfovibrio sp.]